MVCLSIGDGDGDSFPQLEVLHIRESDGLSEVTCRDDVSMPKLKKLLLIIDSNVRLSVSERLAKLRISMCQQMQSLVESIF
ncbi:hypothetical protein KY290_037861 [Solanum tuberosum]|uniref:Uncharacterized protein n=1 Tax=Solanum tuberosum TaxID=4113 RepID=A0ABQ7TYE2_SOLTU|nr:hypothetical protein KY284_037237 [Solanum tuberosum]KAH0739156.1 hypothetical protein KY290_037861 [Solanum tuberosum]